MNEIDLDKIDLTEPPPEHEPERQYYFMAKCREYVRAESKRLGRPLFCATITFGCQKVCNPLLFCGVPHKRQVVGGKEGNFASIHPF